MVNWYAMKKGKRTMWKTRRFNGQTYYGRPPVKSWYEANKQVKGLRKAGYAARLVQYDIIYKEGNKKVICPGQGYRVYYRKKKSSKDD